MTTDPSNNSKAKIQPGYRIGQLTVITSTNQRKNGYNIWCCQCNCGNEILLDTRALQRGTKTDCGCTKKVRSAQKDLTGQRFGRLVCEEPTNQRGKSGGTVWKCRCDCGKECLAISTQLTQGYKKSCGCLSHPPLKAYVGRRFGKLQVISYEGKEKGMHRWRCLCDCGNETVVGQTLLQSGKTQSCGCLQKIVYKDNLQLVDGTSVTILESIKKHTISTNTSGYTGVYKHKRNGKWVAQITFKRKTYYLGSYDTMKDAIEARQIGEEMHDNFLNWYHNEYLAGKKKNEDNEKPQDGSEIIL